MKKTTRLFIVATLAICSTVVARGQESTSTVTASKVTSSSASWTGTGGETWSVSVDGGATNQNVTSGYAQVGTKNSPSTSITFSTSGISGTISSIVVNCAAFQGAATLSATVGGNSFGTQNQGVPSWSSNVGGDVTFSGSASGAIVITMTNGSNGRAMYIKSITVTYTAGGSTTYTVLYNGNGATSGTAPTDATAYASGAQVTVLGNTGNLAKDGYTYGGWNTNVDGSGTNYNAGDTFSISANTTLYAQWTSNAVETTTTIDNTGITNTDVYASTAAGSLSATVKDNNNTPIQGATVTWSSSAEDVATINASGVVTLVAAGSTTITASYAGKTGEYQASSATYDLTVISSEPYVQPTEFDINLNNSLFGTSYTGSVSGITDANPIEGAQDNVNVTYAGGGNHYVNNSQIRFYPSNKLTFEAPSGYVITSIIFTPVDAGTWAATISADSGTYTSSTKTWEGSASSVLFTGSGSSRCDMSKAAITLEEQTLTPSISANNADIEYDATNGSIAYSITNVPSPAGTLTADIQAGYTIADLTLGTITGSAVLFTCSANSSNEERIATVRLTYTYGDNEITTKDVTITQAAAPYSTIPSLFNVATSTAKEVNVTFNNWVVSGISSNGKNVFVTDGINGFVIYSSSDQSSTYAVGNILSGTAVSCSLKLNSGYAQVTDLTASDLSITTGGTVSPAIIEMASLSGVNTGALVSYENLICSIDNNKYYLSDGETTVQLYNSLFAFSALTSGTRYNITGVYQQYGETKEILPRSAEDIVLYVSPDPSIDLASYSVTPSAAETIGTIAITYSNLTISNETDFAIQFYDSVGNEIDAPSWISADVEADNEDYVISYTVSANDGEVRSTYFRVYALEDDYVYSNLVTITQAAYVVDYATLPFDWTGSGDNGSAQLIEMSGVSAFGLGSDYAASNAPYRVKFDSDGDFIQVITDSQPGRVTIGVKMLGGGNTSSITVQESLDGETFTDLEVLTISGSQNNILSLKTSKEFQASSRYVRLYFTKGSNVGVGSISIAAHPASGAITSTNMQSFYDSSKNYELSDGALAYTAGIVNGTFVFYRIGVNSNIIPAGTAVIILSNTEIEFTEIANVPEGTTVHAGNILVGTDTEIAQPGTGTVYVLGVVNETLGFYKLKAGINIPAHRAYYVAE